MKSISTALAPLLLAACTLTPAPNQPARPEAGGPLTPALDSAVEPEAVPSRLPPRLATASLETGLPATGPEDARAVNHAVYLDRRQVIARRHGREWVLIVNGEVHALGSNSGSAWDEAVRLTGDAAHAYLFRPGIDDLDVTFKLSPFRSSDPNWTQLGIRGRRPLRLTLAAAGNVWSRKVDGRVVQVAWGDANAQLRLTAPGTNASTTVRAVPSNLFDEDLTITEDVAEALGLGPFEAPGVARYIGSELDCRKVPLHFSIPELEAHRHVVAYVLPRAITGPVAAAGR